MKDWTVYTSGVLLKDNEFVGRLPRHRDFGRPATVRYPATGLFGGTSLGSAERMERDLPEAADQEHIEA